MPLSQTGVKDTYLLTQMTFPCEGQIKALHLYASVFDVSVTMAIARWSDTPMKDVELIHIIAKSITSVGAQTFSLEDMNIQVMAGDFVVILADSDNPFPVAYMSDKNMDMPGNYPHLVIQIPVVASLFRQGQLINLGNQWQQRRMIFAMSIDVENKHMTFDCRYKKYNDITINLCIINISPCFNIHFIIISCSVWWRSNWSTSTAVS